MLVNGASCNEVATVFHGLGDMALQRHRTNHVSALLSHAHEAKELQQTAKADSLFSQVRTLQSKALSLLEQAERTGDLRTALMAVREIRSCMELLGKITGELSPERILIQLEPSINQIIFILRQEIRDPQSLHRISRRLLAESAKDTGTPANE